MKTIMLLSCIAVYVTVCLLISGCGFKDIDKRYFVVAMGIDATGNEEKPIRITLKLGVPSVDVDAGKSKTQVEVIETDNIAHGLRALKGHVDKEIDFGLCNVFLLGEEYAKTDIRETVTWMVRRRDIQKIAAVGIGSPSAEVIIKMDPKVERFPGNMLSLYFSNDATESSYTFTTLLTDLYRRMNENGLDPILPIVKTEEDKTYIVNSAVLLDKSKTVIELEPDETQLLIQLLARLKPMNGYGGFSRPPYAINIQKISTKFHYQRDDDKLKLLMNIKQNITIDDVPVNAYYDNPEAFTNHLQDAYSEAISKLLTKLQQAGVDPLGFGLRYRALYHLEQFEEEWPALYENIQFQVQTHMSVSGTGLLR